MAVIDVDAGRVFLGGGGNYLAPAGRWYPAVCLVCPPDPWGDGRGRGSRMLGQLVGDKYVYVPMENGMLAEICIEDDGVVHHCEIVTAYTVLSSTDHDPLYLPEILEEYGMHIRPEEGWMIEWLDRMAKKPTPVVPSNAGPPVQIISLKEGLQLWKAEVEPHIRALREAGGVQ